MAIICESCFERCEVVEIDDSYDDLFGTVKDISEGSDCCESGFKEVDDGLLEWHDDLKRLAKYQGKEWLIDSDPEEHKKGYYQELTPGEELANLDELWLN